MSKSEPLSVGEVQQAVESLEFPIGIPEYESWVTRDQVTVSTRYNENWDEDLPVVSAEVSLDLAVKFSEELTEALPADHYAAEYRTGIFEILPR